MFTKACILSLLASSALCLGADAADVRGVVIKADPDKREFAIEGRGRGARGSIMTFVLDKDARILVGKDTGKPADVAVGKRVRVLYETQGEKRVAVEVTVHTSLLAPPTPSPAPMVQQGSGPSGVVRRVAVTDREIVVVSAGAGGAEKEVTFSVPEDAKITRDAKEIRLEELKEGETVVVGAEKSDRQMVARSIQVGAAAAVRAPSKPESRLEKIRQVLKMVDFALQSLDKQQRPDSPRP